MKKIFAGLIVMAAITFSAKAQIRRNNPNSTSDSAQSQTSHYHKHNHTMLASKLGLTDDQKQQMKSINADVKSRLAELKNSNLSTEEYNTKKEGLMKEKKQKMMALLTPDQKDKWKEYKKEQHGKRKMNTAKRMEKMKEKLALSNDQVTKINAQREAYKSKFEDIKNNQSLSVDDKKAQMKALREERKNSFNSLLTPDQEKKLEEIKEKRTGRAA